MIWNEQILHTYIGLINSTSIDKEMTPETKYNIGDKAWFMHDNKAKSAIIIKINVVIEKDMNCTGVHTSTLYYLFDYCAPYIESKLFPTKEELLASL